MSRETPVRIDPDGGFIVDAGFVAPRLGLAPEDFLALMRRGEVFQTVERGEGDDEGRTRLTFRHRAKQTRFVVDAAGALIEDTISIGEMTEA